MSIQIHLYNGAGDNMGKLYSVKEAFETITGDRLKIVALRKNYELALRAETKEEKEKYQNIYDSLKAKLPAVTWSGIFAEATTILSKHRPDFLKGKFSWKGLDKSMKIKTATRAIDQLLQHSGLMCIDIDKLYQPNEVDNLLLQLHHDPHTHACFVSPSGYGIKILFRIDPDQHAASFLAIEKYFKEKYNKAIDKSGKDVSRLCFLTYDPNLFINEYSQVFTIGHAEAPAKVTKLNRQQASALHHTDEDLYSVIAFTDNVMTYGPGNHNNYILLFACNANRKGFSLDETLSFSTLHFSNKNPHEVKTTVESAYTHNTHEHGKFKKLQPQGNNTSTKSNKKISDKSTNNNTPSTTKQTSGEDDMEVGGAGSKFKPFWKLHKFKKGKGDGAIDVERLELSRVDFSDFLFSQGFHLLSTGKQGYQICHSANGVIKPVDPQEVKQYVLSWCRQNNLRDVEEMLRKGQKQYFAFNELDSLPYKKIEFQKDTQAESFFYFRNCWVKVTARDITTHDYKDLEKYIWEGNKIDADFKKQLSPFALGDNGDIDIKVMECEFAKFLCLFSYNPESPDEKDFTAAMRTERFWSIATAYGFLLDGYKHPAIRKGIFAVDHKIGDKNEQHGRTGKSIIPKAASYLKVVSTINGKSFNPQYQFKYEPITMDSQIVNFNDMPRNFDVETIFEVIADDYSITRRNNGYINFLYSESPKPYISTNFTPKGEGASYSGRMHVIEACDYFSDTRSPYDEFGHALFTDWTPEQWNLFYNTSLQCVQALKIGGLRPYPHGNFEIRKLVNDVVPEFIDFMDSDAVLRNERIGKIEIFDKFNNEMYVPLYGQKLKPHTFHKWVKQYCKNKFLQFNPHRNGNHDKSNGKEYYLLADKNWKPEQTKLL